ncbi:MAG: hypothetical protein LBU60_04305 [Clostridiales bacterium]|jgi:F0F1-type ATP synthase assembly protein I|nr:hypothetical protein [Clostridiales bacterium]
MTDMNTLKQELAKSQKSRSIRTKLIIFVLALILPISAVMIAMLQTKHGSPISMDNQIAINRQKMHETNRSHFNDLFGNMHTDTSISRTSVESEETSQMFDLGFSVLDKMEEGQDIESIFNYLMENLSEDIQNEVKNIFASFGNSESEENSQSVSRGWHRTHLVFAMDIGYATGTLASYLVGLVVSKAFSTAAWMLGPFGIIITMLLGFIVGEIVTPIINNLVFKWNGRIPGFRYVLGTISLWWFWGSSDNDLNIIDILFLIVGGIGGKMGRGSMPAGSTPPRFA